MAHPIAVLIKSGIVVFVGLATALGYLVCLPAGNPVAWTSLFFAVLGTTCLGGGASALNQLQERDLDARMDRTKRRPLPSGALATRDALTIGIVLVCSGLLCLAQLPGPALYLGLSAPVLYNFFYTYYWKPKRPFAAVPGALPGALPVLIGAAAAEGRISSRGIYMFLVMFLWQMPHFWVLALRFKKDYAQGAIPTLPVRLGTSLTHQQIVVWCGAYLGTAALAPLVLSVGWIYVLGFVGLSTAVVLTLKAYLVSHGGSREWVRFFLSINASLIGFFAFAYLDQCSVFAWIPLLTR